MAKKQTAPAPLVAMTPAEIRQTLARVGAVAADFSNLATDDAMRYVMGLYDMGLDEAGMLVNVQQGGPGDLIEVAK